MSRHQKSTIACAELKEQPANDFEHDRPDSRDDVFNDLFDASGTPTELIQHWAELEKQTLEALPDPLATLPMPGHLRAHTLRCLQGLCSVCNLSPAEWCQAVLLLDICWAKGAVDIDSLPSSCGAIVGMVNKNIRGDRHDLYTRMMPVCTAFAQHLCHMGYIDCQYPTPQSCRCEDCNLLRILDRQIHQASLSAWIPALVKRIVILSNNNFGYLAQWMMQQSLSISTRLIMQISSADPLSPRRIANGIVCLLLVAAKLLPVDILLPGQLSLEEGPIALPETLFPGFAQGPCMLPAAERDWIVKVLEEATACELNELKQDALAVTQVLKA